MKRLFSIMIFVLTVASVGCGGATSETGDRNVILGVAWPAEVFALESPEQAVTVHFTSLDSGSIESSTELTESGSQSLYTGTVSGLDAGNYEIQIDVETLWNGTPATFIPSLEYKGQINLVEGQSDIVVDLAPSEWFMDFDADLDGLNNLSEMVAGTHPLDEDTDADGIVDGSDNCPVVANPDQSDLDADGIGDLCDPDPQNMGSVS